MAHVRWHATIHLSWFLGLIQDPDASHTNPYACPGSQCITCKTLRCKSLCWGSLPTMPNIAYACSGSQRFTRKILMPVQAPDNSNNCLCQGSLVTAPTLSYGGAGTQCFTPKSLRLCRLPKIQQMAYARAGFQQFTCKSLRQHFTRKILTLVQVTNNSDRSLRLGSLPTILKIPYMNKINSM
ncbi:hypothetical protein O181_060471 [Austropuccinia psidii MF-1]|uniref:Uncharacterized protein n=1 Tax=Austropuccinia psidii MF-1 TaxID=1389203 RepID=A0A9Q3EE80_9BASI|nr:hypothetical protein [Austropuccinia psidii MF-1]